MSMETTPVEDLGRELGDAIADMPAYERFAEAKAAVEESEDAQREIEKFEQRRQEFMMMRQTGDASQADLEALQDAQEELHEMPVMAEFVEAQQELDAKLAAINDAISEPLAIDFGQEAGGCCED
jgi:cell fate (sporulation/competence/biofilm development) regulator YlbF (YheA/YmcA/DUF963 family)